MGWLKSGLPNSASTSLFVMQGRSVFDPSLIVLALSGAAAYGNDPTRRSKSSYVGIPSEAGSEADVAMESAIIAAASTLALLVCRRDMQLRCPAEFRDPTAP